MEQGLIVYEVSALREARAVIVKKPEAALRYLYGNAPTVKHGLMALVLSALLEHTKQHNEIVKFVSAVIEYVKTEVHDDTL